MAGIDQNTLWQLASMILGKPKEVTTTRERATFLRTDQDGTQWVRLPSSNDETPVNGRTLATAKAGDTVEWSIHDGRLSITGNESQPSVGMREVFQTASDIVQPVVARISKVNELASLSKSVADAAQQVAEAVNQHFFADTNGVHVTEATQDDWDENHEGANVLLNATGQLFRDGLTNLLTLTTQGGARALSVWDGLGNTASHIRAIIGEVITLGPIGSVQMILSATGLSIDNENGDEIFAIDSSTTGSVTVPLDVSLVTWNTTADVDDDPHVVSDDGATVGDTTVVATINENEYPLDSTYATATVTAGTGVSVALTSAGITYVQGLMVVESEGDGGTVTTTYPCELSVEYQHAVTDIALLSLIGSQTVLGEGNVLYLANNRWLAGTRQTGTLLRIRNAATGREVKLGVSNNGYTRGLWDSFKNDWLVARNKDNKTVINGPNFSVSSAGEVNASGAIASFYQVSAKGNGDTAATKRIVALRSNSAGNRGLYDVSLDKWILYKRPDGTLLLSDPLYIRENTCTVNTSNATASGDNKCWSNGAAVSFAYTFSVKSALASGSSLAVGTLPSGYRPPYNFAAEVYTSNASNVLAVVSTTGAITIRNVGSGSLATTTTIRVSGTFVP